METDWFCINDFEDFVNSARTMVFKLFGNVNEIADDTMTGMLSDMSKEEIEELEETLSFSESVLIVKSLAKKKTNKRTKLIKYFINEKILAEIIEELNTRMISNILTKLTSQGVLESGYDESINDFVFWIKDAQDNTQNKENPETD